MPDPENGRAMQAEISRKGDHGTVTRDPM